MMSSNSNALIYLLICLIGASIGSFLNVVISRLPVMLKLQWEQESRHPLLARSVIYRRPLGRSEQRRRRMPAAGHFNAFNLFYPSSHCPHCHTPIKGRHNIPLISFFILQGKCHSCKHPIALRYPLVEASTAMLFTASAAKFGLTTTGLASLVFSSLLIVMVFIDWEHQLLPDCLTLTLLWIGLLVNINTPNQFVSLNQAVIGAAAGYLSLWFIVRIFYLVTGKIGMGGGDLKLFAALGAWFGWTILPMLMLAAALSGLIGGFIILRLQGQSRHTPIPFGPFLALAGWCTLFSH